MKLRGVGIGVVVAASVIFLCTMGRSASQPPTRMFELRYSAVIPDLPATAHQVQIWVPLAKTRDNQRILSRQIQTPYPYEIHQEPVFGNDILYMTLASPLPAQIDLTVTYRASVQREPRLGLTKAKTVAVSQVGASTEELAPALRSEPFIVVDDAITRLARQVTEGHATDVERARAIYDYTISHMSYDKTTPGWGQGDSARACLLGKGNCTDFHSLFISMARSVGLPARFVIGAPIPAGPGGPISSYHCWAEFYTPQHGWVPVDASEAWKHPDVRDYYFGTRDENRLLISSGRNVQLMPAQAGPPVNIFIYPYVEVDDAPLAGVQTRFEFTQT
ncbi:MAG: transglutaminase domain-containing protein [Candidatus Omnitrophica bacterium]|nr:transglutaminase domain-containing protein [Candidatus Omnitrophota bacterium]